MGKTIKRSVKIVATASGATRRSLRLHAGKLTPMVAKSVDIVSSIKCRGLQVSSSNKVKKMSLSRAFETRYEAKGYTTLIGVDEAGRGPLAGPVVVAACHVPINVTIAGIDDSKKILEPQREKLFELLTNHPSVTYAVHVNSAQRIDEINILQATLESMTKSVNEVAERLQQTDKTFVLVDGNKLPTTLELPAEAVVKGDSKVFSIAAASIIAKVTRDRLMREYDKQYPQYGLAQHKGYPTNAHVTAIAKHGACAIHRMTFAPLKAKEVPKAKSLKKRVT
ncbi:unnamed protein product [Peronospora destructor]|uniref:Ribonuclease n=1 Tax=Peronospora destructor TaxID=86335 RepID=A0AAV0TAQ7_9STRA|nr:unnamed protein product [Peronospora destructor]